MQVGVLGALVVEGNDGRTLPPLAPRLRRLLAALVVGGGRVVSTDRLAEIVFGDAQPADPVRSLQTYVSRLRTAIASEGADAPSAVERVAPGYRLVPEVVGVDAVRFTDAYAAATEAAEITDRLALLEEALQLWRGSAFGEFADEDWARPSAIRLDELRLDALEAWFECRLALGEHEASVAELSALVQEHPLREGLWSALMRALAGAGRQAEALRAFQDHRAWLATELGLEPSDELVSLEQRISQGEREPVPSRDRLRSYELSEIVGEGAFAIVWRGTQPILDREVAVKQIRAELANRPEFIRRFEAEAQLIAHLEHPYVVPLYDYWREPDSAYLVMRYLRGGTLATLIDDRTLTIEECRRFVEQVGTALGAAHRAGVVHRDVKPGNVFLDGEGNFYLGDFGIAHLAEVVPQPEDALSPGTPAYAAPEQLRREAVGPPADVHGLACTVFEALTARLPFHESAGHGSTLARRLAGDLPSVRELRSDVPVAVDEVLAKAAASEPSDRHEDALAFTEAMLAALSTSPFAPAVPVGRDVRSTTISDDLLRSIVGRNPYKGLLAFGEADAADFFGRERLVDRLVDRLDSDGAAGRLAAVVGPSGSGKSSLVRAGLVPALRADAIAGSSSWFVTTMTPGRAPFEELEEALLRVASVPRGDLVGVMTGNPRGITRAVKQCVPDATEVVIVIDQFEELFTLCPDEAVRARFLEGLLEAVDDDRSRVRIVLTMRADFVDRPLRYPGVGQAFEQATLMVSPLAPDELERAIVEPVGRLGMTFEPGLVSAIVADVLDQPGALPLLQYALTELYEAQVSGMLTEASYQELGGLSGALAQRAEELYTSLGAQQQTAARRLFPRLVTLGEGTADTRRRVLRVELGDESAVAEVLDAFGAARLLSFDRDPESREPTVEVAHEALLREWPRLRGWVDDDRDTLRIQRHLTEAAAAWQARGRDDGDLYRGARLDGAVDLVSARATDLNELERRFVDESRRTAEAEASRRARQNRRLQRALVGVGVLLVCALVAGVLAVGQRNDARDAAFEAESLRLAASVGGLVDSDPSVALVLAAETFRRSPGPETLGALQRAMSRTGPLLGVRAPGRDVRALEWVDDDRIVMVVDDGLEILMVSAGTTTVVPRVRPILMPVEGRPTTAVSGDGDTIAVATADGVAVVAAESAAVTGFVDLDPIVGALAFAPDGQTLYAGDFAGSIHEISVETASVTSSWIAHAPAPWQTPAGFDFEYGDVIAQSIVDRGVSGLAVAKDMVVSAGGLELAAWDRETGAQISRGYGGEEVEGMSPRLAIPLTPFVAENEDHFLVLGLREFGAFDVESGEQVWRSDDVLDRTALGVLLFASDSDGRMLVAVGSDNRLRVVDPAKGDLLRPELDSPIGMPRAVRVAPDGRQMALATSRGVALLSTEGSGLLTDALPLPPATEKLFIAQGGGRLSASSFSVGTTEVFDRVGERFEPALTSRTDLGWLSLPGVRFGDGVAEWRSVSGAGDVRFLEPSTLEPLGAWIPDAAQSAHDPTTDRLFVSPTLDTLAGEPRVLAYSIPAGLPTGFDVRLPEEIEWRTAPALQIVAPDGALLMLDLAGVVHSLDTRTGDLSEGPFQTEQGVIRLRYGPERDKLYVTRADGAIEERDATSYDLLRTLIGPEPPSHDDGPGLHLDPARDHALTVAARDPRLVAFGTGTQIGDPFPQNSRGVIISGADATPDSPLQLVTVVDEDMIVWNLDTDSWFDIACDAAGRNLTREEWDRLGPRDSGYRATCEQWPTSE